MIREKAQCFPLNWLMKTEAKSKVLSSMNKLKSMTKFYNKIKYTIFPMLRSKWPTKGTPASRMIMGLYLTRIAALKRLRITRRFRSKAFASGLLLSSQVTRARGKSMQLEWFRVWGRWALSWSSTLGRMLTRELYIWLMRGNESCKWHFGDHMLRKSILPVRL